MIRPTVLESDRPHGPWSCRGRDIWEAFRAAETGDADALRRLLERDPNLYRSEYWYTQPIHFAVREGHLEAVRVLLEAGADPAWKGLAEDLITTARDRGHEDVVQELEKALARCGEERGDKATSEGSLQDPNAGVDPLGAELHAAASADDHQQVEALLARGADPNTELDSAGSATYAARTPEIRRLLIEHGGRLDPYDLVWLGENEAALRQVSKDPESAHRGCGGVLAAACKTGQRELLEGFLEAGVRVPPVLTECRSYLFSEPDFLRRLLASGMDPNLPDWQHATPLHDLCGRDYRGRPRPHREECATILLDAGASISARDEDYRSTPLAWAARSGLPEMVALLLDRGAPVEERDAETWATPLSWASRRGHNEVAELLCRAGATPRGEDSAAKGV